ncbi:Hypothetical protein D9617_18g034260 [Elsinoe fawcettii]|nr:Hypothetical protein D9617_18g034260 [Elsinoe fawcettii]
MSSPLLRAGLRRTALPRAPLRPAVRYQSTSSSSHTTHILAGLAGGALVLTGGYALYSFSAAGRLHSSLSKSAKSAQEYYNSATQQFQQSKPDANEAIEYLRRTAYQYAAFIPGGRGYVDTAFKDLDAVREQHGDKVEEIVNDGYQKLQNVVKEVSKDGFSIAAVTKVFEVVEGITKRLGQEASVAMGRIIENHPELKDKVGGQIEQLKTMGDQFGPDAKKKVEQTYQEISDLLKGGVSADTISKAKKLVEEKVQELQKFSDKAWDEGLKQVKPYLDKNPKIKQLVEENADALKKGDTKQLFEKVKSSIDSGNLDDLKSYVDQATKQAQQFGENAWNEVLKRAQPYLEKNPKVKDLVEKNADALKKGDTKQLFEKVKKSVESGNMDDLKGFVEQAKGQAQKLGEDAWKEVMKRAQPYLDKNPKIKELLEKNQDALRGGDAKEIFERVKKAAEKGDVEDLKGYVEEVAKKAKQ